MKEGRGKLIASSLLGYLSKLELRSWSLD
jgi:hypothetical protein